ncbi:oxidoreductase [Streptomyces sp. NPDC017615]|uniref:oxidoreductase n=1 Tax=Streptomyces sp. NPDC017615 TaxID=3365003 RepID=UPI0037B2ED79
MSPAYATFGLEPATRVGAVLADGGYQVHRDFVDFVVDGRPLLLRLSDLDAVSPLAADLPPAVLDARVRALLLEDEPPLPGGRFVLYGCPECADLGCGAVTVVIERDGDDFRWRDFAWQTGEHVDLERDGYHGTGPFHFHGPAYRAALTALLDGVPAAVPPRRVLLIGPRVGLLAKLAAALRGIGIGADITLDAATVPAEELNGYGAALTGPTLPEPERAAVREAFGRPGVDTVLMAASAPIVPLLVAQVQQALDRSPAGSRRLTALTATPEAAEIEVSAPGRVQLTAYRLDRLRRTRSHTVLDATLGPGSHCLPLGAGVVRGETYLVARTSGGVLVAPVRGGSARD